MSAVIDYEEKSDAIAREFAAKHDLIFDKDSWIGGRYDMIEMSDYYIDVTTMYLDLKHSAPKDIFFSWYDYSLTSNNGNINYNSWIMGARPETLSETKK